MNATPAWLNGRYLPLQEACVPVLDRGFLFGDGVYEVIPAYGGRPFRLAQHLRRLEHSLAGIGMAPPLEDAAWERIFRRLMAADPGGDWSLYLQVTRGPAAVRDHAFPAATTPTLLAWATPIAPPAGGGRGIAAVTLEDIRWQRCDLKAITLLGNCLLRQQARERGAYEAILVRDGLANEGAASNLFVVLDGELRTPPKGEHLLPGITRDLVLELAREQGVPHREADIPAADLRRADEVWLTSSTREIMPVVRLDDRPVGAGVPGPWWARMNEHYQAAKQALREGRHR